MDDQNKSLTIRKPKNKNMHRTSISKVFSAPDTESVCSATSDINVAFFGSQRPMQTSAHSWKSQSTQMADEFGRMQRLMKFVAPEQFKNPAKPSNGPCDIVPTTILGYVEHSKDILQIKTEQMEKNLAAKKAANRLKKMTGDGEVQPAVKSRFGKDAKIYSDGLSPVLCQTTMWSAEHSQTNSEDVEWPTQVELQECGDRRENDRIPTRCGRYLPPPKTDISNAKGGILTQTQGMKRFSPLDEQGPIFSKGPSPVEVTTSNAIMDNDPIFEDRGHIYLGTKLMEEVGE